MAANVIDELIVRLTLDAEQYRSAERDIDRNIDRTERKTKERARTADLRDRDQQRRLKDLGAGMKAFATQAAAAIGVVTGIGVAVGGALTGLLSFETGLRRQSVGTAMSNREMQAWGATARRLGADAAAGAEAIAALAKERQQFELTGQAPTVMALSRMGVRVDRNASIEDILAQAQQLYRSAPEGQKQQFENTLAAQGVSADLILMIKSEMDVREAYARSFAQASEENRKALDALADSLESMKAQAIAVTSSLLTALQPAIEKGAEKLADFAAKVAEFSNDVQEAGGGVEAFQQALDKHAPWLGHLFEGFRMESELLSQGMDVVRDGFRQIGDTTVELINRFLDLLNKIRLPGASAGLVTDVLRRLRSSSTDGTVAQTRSRVREWLGANEYESTTFAATNKLADFWSDLVGTSQRNNARADVNAAGGRFPTREERMGLPRNIENDVRPMTPEERRGLPRNIENDVPPAPAAARGGTRGVPTPQALMTKIITEYGLTVPEAAAVVANWQRESSLNPAAINREGGGTGARGLAQWRGARTKAFQERYGVMPDQATVEQQVEFAFTDPYERKLIAQSLRQGQTAAELGTSVSKYYEAHGNVQEDLRRGRDAQRLADEYARNNATRGPQQMAATGTTVNIQNMTVQADQPQAFVGGLERLSGSQNYNSVVR